MVFPPAQVAPLSQCGLRTATPSILYGRFQGHRFTVMKALGVSGRDEALRPRGGRTGPRQGGGFKVLSRSW